MSWRRPQSYSRGRWLHVDGSSRKAYSRSSSTGAGSDATTKPGSSGLPRRPKLKAQRLLPAANYWTVSSSRYQHRQPPAKRRHPRDHSDNTPNDTFAFRSDMDSPHDDREKHCNKRLDPRNTEPKQRQMSVLCASHSRSRAPIVATKGRTPIRERSNTCMCYSVQQYCIKHRKRWRNVLPGSPSVALEFLRFLTLTSLLSASRHKKTSVTFETLVPKELRNY